MSYINANVFFNDKYSEFETEYFCNYPEKTKKSKLTPDNLEKSSICSNISYSDNSEKSTSFSGSEKFSHTTRKSISIDELSYLKNNISGSSSVKSTFNKDDLEEENSIEEESDEDEENITKETPRGWFKYSKILSPWDGSIKPFSQKPGVQIDIIDGVLTKEVIFSGSSIIDQLPDTKEFILTKLQLSNKTLKDIKLLSVYKYFQYIDLSWNDISDLSSISTLYLMCLDVSHNKLTSVLDFQPPWFLTYVNLSCNEITHISDLSAFWSLRHLNLSYNCIEEVEGLQNLKFLQYLNLSHNNIKCVMGLNNISLVELHLEYNEINNFEEYNSNIELKQLPKLTQLYLSRNQIKKLSFLSEAFSLKLLDISNNCISESLEIHYLGKLKNLNHINLMGNDVTEWPSYREYVIYSVPNLMCLDLMLICEKEKVAAKSLFAPDIFTQYCFSHGKLNLLNQLSKQTISVNTIPVDQPPFPIVVLVGPPATNKRNLATRLASDYFKYVHYCSLYTTSDSSEKDLKSKVVTLDQFNEMMASGQFLAVSELLGDKYGVCREDLFKNILENKVSLLCLPLEAAMGFKALNLCPHLVLTVIHDVTLYTEKLKLKFESLKPLKKSRLSDISQESIKEFEPWTSYTIANQGSRKQNLPGSECFDPSEGVSSSKLTISTKNTLNSRTILKEDTVENCSVCNEILHYKYKKELLNVWPDYKEDMCFEYNINYGKQYYQTTPLTQHIHCKPSNLSQSSIEEVTNFGKYLSFIYLKMLNKISLLVPKYV
uniref:Dynein axonemal assembly factor 1 homolog n=2 Tax=Clastoptera arizonana TaxID=38151 RepID=A0A1B6CGX8_9HEMI